MAKDETRGSTKISLAPLDFEEAVGDLLKVQPPSKEKPAKERKPRAPRKGTQEHK